MEEKTCKILFDDEDHCWISGRQFVSLHKTNRVRVELYNEVELLNNRIKVLTKENEAYKVLLKEKLTEQKCLNKIERR